MPQSRVVFNAIISPRRPHISPVMPGSLGKDLLSLTPRSSSTTCSCVSAATLVVPSHRGGPSIVPVGLFRLHTVCLQYHRSRGEVPFWHRRLFPAPLLVKVLQRNCWHVRHESAESHADWPRGHRQRPGLFVRSAGRRPSPRPVPLAALSTALSSARSSRSDNHRW